MRTRFGIQVGVSDHSLTNIIPVTAVALGATVIEKHIILDKKLGGVDSAFSLNPEEFSLMVKEIRDVEKALGEIDYTLKEEDKLRRRSLFVVKDMKKGDVITVQNVCSVRPGFGMPPKYLKDILGKRVNADMKKGERMSVDKIDNSVGQ